MNSRSTFDSAIDIESRAAQKPMTVIVPCRHFNAKHLKIVLAVQRPCKCFTFSLHRGVIEMSLDQSPIGSVLHKHNAFKGERVNFKCTAFR